MMLPFQVSDAKCSPQSTAYPYVYHTVDGNAPAIIMGQASEVSFVPVVGMHAPLWNPRRILKSNKEIKAAGDAFEAIAKRNGIKVSSEDTVGRTTADYFQILARRNGIKVSISEDVKNECEESFVSEDETDDENGVIERAWTEDSGMQPDALKMFNVILNEKKEFEKKQMKVLQDYIKEQENSKKALASNLQVLNEKDASLKKLEQRNTMLSNEVDLLTEKLMELRAENTKRILQVTTLTNNLEQKETSDERLQNAFDRLNQKYLIVLKENERLKAQVTKLNNNLEQNKTSNERLQNAVDRLNQKYLILLRENERINYVDVSVQTAALVGVSSVPTSNQYLNPHAAKKSQSGNMYNLDRITLKDSEDDWTVVKHPKKVKAKNTMSFSPPEKSQTVAGRSRRAGSLCEITWNDNPYSLFGAGHQSEHVEAQLRSAEKIVDGSGINEVDTSCVPDELKSSVYSAYSELEPREVTMPSSTAGQRCSVGNAMLKPNDGTETSNSGVLTPVSEAAKSSTAAEDTAPGATSNAVYTTCSTTMGTTTINEGTSLNDSAIGNSSKVSTNSSLHVGPALSELDLLAKQLGFGENWHQNILKTYSVSPDNTVPLLHSSLKHTTSVSSALDQVLGRGRTQHMTESVSKPKMGSLDRSVGAASISHLPYHQQDSNAAKLSGFRNGNNQSGQTETVIYSGESPLTTGTSSFEQLMLRLIQRFPSKTRSQLVVFLKRAKSSFGEQGFRKKKTEEIVRRVGEEIHQEELSGKMCCICRDVLEYAVKTLECGHTFHGECVAEWISKERTCPLCRSHALTQEDFPTLS